MSCGVGCRRGSDPAAPIGPLAWEPQYAAGLAKKKKKNQPLTLKNLGVAIVAQR